MTDEKRRKRKPRKGRGQRSNSASLPEVEWVNPSPSKSDKDWLETNTDKLPDLVFELLDDMSDTERLSVKYDKYANRWSAIYFGGEATDGNAGLALSVRAATTFDALCLLAYFHVVRYARTWEIPPSEDIGRWG